VVIHILVWKDFVFNDFEKPIFEDYPILAEIKDQLYQDGALYAAMSGSGSALYGIFEQGNTSSFETKRCECE
jgi:4-diphosphocytidyl-2-C-methyl-D-erythritol kinase